MTDSAILRFNRDLLFEIETDGTPEGSIVTAPFSGTIPGGGPVLSFESKVETVIPLIVDINPFQEGSGDPSPTNVRPISGWNNVNVYVSPTTDAEDGTTYPISLGQTVYGGVLDVVSGNGTSEFELYNLRNANPNNITEYTVNNKRGVAINYIMNKVSTRAKGWCDTSTVTSETNPNLPQYMWFGVNSRYLFWVGILDVLNMTLAEFKTWLSSHDVQIVREVATPTELTLTPTEVKSLLGQNNIWADSGDVYTIISTENVTYKITGGAEDVQRFDKIWRSLLLYRDGGFTDRYKNLSGKGVEIISHGPAILKED